MDVPFLQEDCQTLAVRRRHIWADTKRALSRPFFNDKIGLNVVFVGEPALDAGGPLREYFRLLWLSVHQNLHLFNGKEMREFSLTILLPFSNRSM